MIFFENYFTPVYLCLIVALQSAVGVGVLVLGTPFLLIKGYSIVEILFYLLPLSILTSVINLIITSIKKKQINFATSKEFKKFYLACVPSIIVGVLILKYYQELINFKILVGFVIILSIILIVLKNRITFKINFFRISILSIVGVIHGLTNSGGTLMSLILSNEKNKLDARYSITFFYFILASIQYLITVVIFKNSFIYSHELLSFLIMIFGIILGNLFIIHVSQNIYKFLIYFLALISSIILMIS